MSIENALAAPLHSQIAQLEHKIPLTQIGRAVARSGINPGSGSAEGGQPSAEVRGVPEKTLFPLLRAAAGGEKDLATALPR